MITEATAEQWQEIERIRIRWLRDEQTAQYPIDRIRRCVRETLDRINQPKGVPIWVVDSPLVARLISAITKRGELQEPIQSNLDASLDSSLRANLDAANLDASLAANLRANLSANLHADLDASLRANLHDNLTYNLAYNLYANLAYNLDDTLSATLSATLYDNLDAKLRDTLNDNLDANLSATLYDNLADSLADSLNVDLNANLVATLSANLYANLRENLDANMDAKLAASLSDSLNFYSGVWWNYRAGWFEGAKCLGVPDIEEYEPFLEWNRVCPVWMWDERQIFILRRPQRIHWQSDDGVLHNEEGPSVYYSPFFKLWHINGVGVDEQIVMKPETQTIEQIRGEQNEEVKRIRIERFGWTRYLEGVSAAKIDEREDVISNTLEKLYRGDGMTCLVCVCPSTAKVFALEVPPETETCEQAQNYLSGGLNRRTIAAA